ncbi:MAG: LysE family transporter [Candidatus Gracilibacteria bacterium]
MSLISQSALLFGFTQGFVIGPLSLFAIREGLNPKKGFWYQMQVYCGSILVDIFYLMLATYGAAKFIENDIVQVIMWSLAAYMLINMGINTFHERPKRMSFHNMHRQKLKFYQTDFFRGFALNIVNPMAIVFWIVVAGSMYGDYASTVSPGVFAMNIVVGGIPSCIIVALLTLLLREVFHTWMLKKLMQAGSLVLVGYGLWFTWKAANCLPGLVVGFASLF